MPLTEQLRSVARFEYGVLRSALSTVDRTVLTPLADRSPGFERVVTRARDAVAELSERFGNTAAPGPAPRPAPAAAPAAQTPIEVPADEPAAETPAEAPAENSAEDIESAAADAGSAVLDADDAGNVEEVDELAEELLEADAVHVTGELAENDDLREVQARLRAKHALQEADEQHR